jgi:hypothetical protein
MTYPAADDENNCVIQRVSSLKDSSVVEIKSKFDGIGHFISHEQEDLQQRLTQSGQENQNFIESTTNNLRDQFRKEIGAIRE